jgi:hypothetical protein
LLGNNREISNYKITIIKDWLSKQDMFPWQKDNRAIIEEKFSMQSMLTCYEVMQSVRELLGFSHCELLLLEAGG